MTWQLKFQIANTFLCFTFFFEKIDDQKSTQVLFTTLFQPALFEKRISMKRTFGLLLNVLSSIQHKFYIVCIWKLVHAKNAGKYSEFISSMGKLSGDPL